MKEKLEKKLEKLNKELENLKSDYEMEKRWNENSGELSYISYQKSCTEDEIEKVKKQLKEMSK